jgi:very-short-patch-repair endonuclease
MRNALFHRIDIWKKLLLDFGKRNRLINFKETKRSNVAIVTPSFNELFEKIVGQEKSLSFSFATRVRIDDEGEESYDAVVRGDIETSKTVGELQKTLKVLRGKANTSIEEQGINTLFLAFGMLRWTEANHSDQLLASPIILVPVKLTIESLASPYVLALHEDEIVVNPTLSYKLMNDFGITFPEFDASKDEVGEYFSKLDELFKNKDWKITKEVNLTILSFQKINMYKDLERNEERLQANKIITALAGDSDSLTIPDGLDNYDHDSNTKPIDTYQVVDADSSQQDAILLSKSGASFVLQGPPGTGKSQTITNIIAEALADGKKVLFVSEKKAALQVVYDRLRKVGLSDFCLTLHDHKANKKEILRELESSIYADRKKVREEALAQLDALEKKRVKLNQYQQELHKPCSALKTSVYSVNGRLAKLGDAPDVIFNIPSPENTTQEDLNDREYLLSELSKVIGRRSEDYANSVWRNAKIDILTNELRHDIDSRIDSLLPLLSVLRQSSELCNEYLKLDIKPSVHNVKEVISLLSFAGKSPIIPSKWVLTLDNTELTHMSNTVDRCSQAHSEIIVIQHEILKRFDKEILELHFYPLLKKFRSEYNNVFRSFKSGYKNDLKAIKLYLSEGSKLEYSQALEVLNNLKLLSDRKSEIENELTVSKVDLHDYNRGINTNWDEVSEALKFAIDFKKILKNQSVPNDFVVNVCEDKAFVAQCTAILPKLSLNYGTVEGKLKWVSDLFDESVELEKYNINDLIDKLTKCKEKKHLLEEWVDYRSNRRMCDEKELSSYLDQVEESSIATEHVVNAYMKRFYRLWLDAVHPLFPAVQSFRGDHHSRLIQEFSELDGIQLKIAQSRIRERVCNRFPDFNSATSTRDEVGVLKRELHKQRRIMPLRKLFAAIPNLLPTLRPCFMMSPLSVSVFLEAQSYTFDLVIFDEASQVHTEDAVGAIMRGKQVIIVGDTKQLPPTNFFAAAIDDEDYDVDSDDKDYAIGAYQSILDESVTVLPERSLRWHYRSRHEHLIAFSNIKIYNSSLITFPSNVERAPDCGVEYIHVADGLYDRGGKRSNINEAKKVAELVFEHIRKHPNRSLGIVTFSEAQQSAVDTVIRQKRLENGMFEEFFSEEKDEPFFIKNLETVQGDERDTIIFSIGYAKDEKGIMYMNFGPLSKDGGHRRLNVAVTRAKYNVKLVGSIVPTDIDTDRTSGEGVRLLRSYIEFAQQGIVALQKELSYTEILEFDSPFEEAVYDFLTSKGYKVTTQVGCSGFRVDMAVKHPDLPGVFAIGIECDGVTYHSARTARERDRIRQTILEDMGWTIHRIWSTDWIKNQKNEEEKLIEAVERALNKSQNEYPKDNSQPIGKQVVPPIVEIEEIVRVDKNANKGHGFVPYRQANLFNYPNLHWLDLMKKVIEIEQPIHFEDLCQRVAPLFGNQKSTSKVRGSMEYYLRNELRKDIVRKGDFITLTNFNHLQVRIPGEYDNYVRPIGYISDDELELAVLTIVNDSFGLMPDDLLNVTARELGYKRTGENISASLRRVYKKLLKGGKIREIEGKVALTT